MAKRFSCWVIVAGASPTAFRARRAEDLLPTLRQLQRTQPDVAMKWFDRGRFWNSPEEAEDALKARRQAAAGRGRDWRPGGSHVDPRAKYQLSRDEKRARFKRNQRRGGLSRPSDVRPKGPAGETRPPDTRPPDTRWSGETRPPDYRRPEHRGRKPGPSRWSRPGGPDRPHGNRPPKESRPPDHRPPDVRSRKPGSSRWPPRPAGHGQNRPQGHWGSSERRPAGGRPPRGPFKPRRDNRGKKPK